MNRATFFQKLTFFSGILFGVPAYSKSKKDSKIAPTTSGKRKPPLRKEIADEFAAKNQETPWGQKVFFDRYTYMDFKKSNWRIEGKSYEEIESMAGKLEGQIDRGEIGLRNGSAKLAKGLYLIDVDGQQNIYLLESENGLILIDPSMDSTTDIVIEQVRSLGYDPGDIRFILLTHCHVDHAQSAAYWQSRGAEVFIHENDKNAVLTGNEITAWWLITDQKYRNFPPLKEVNAFHDGDVLNFGEHKLFVCHTPGHTPGSCSFYLRLEGKNILVSGDTIFHNGKHGWMGHPYVDYEAYIKSLWKLRNFAVEGVVHNEEGRLMVRDRIEFDMLLPGHTAISMSNVTRDIDKGLEIMPYTIQQRRKGIDYQWTEPYTFFAERVINNEAPIKLEYR